MERMKMKARNLAIIACLRKGKCLYCGADSANLEFHHRVLKDKGSDISRMKWGTLAALNRELAKCDIICNICHKSWHRWNKYVRGLGYRGIVYLPLTPPLPTCYSLGVG